MLVIEGPIKWGIIGCGDVCEVKSGPAFSKIEGSSLAAVMRRDESKAADFARRHHVPTFYSNASNLIHDPEVNAIYIATPPESHEQYAVESMAAGKPVYIEKPVTLDSASCLRMINASKKFSMPAVVAHYRRELELFKRVREHIQKESIGKVRLVMLRLFQAPKLTGPAENWRVDPSVSGGGLFYDLAPHQLDIIYWLFGRPHTVFGHSINQGKHYNAPDITSLSMTFDDNILFQGLWSFNVTSNDTLDSCKIIGESGSLEFPFFASFTKAALQIVRRGSSTSEEFVFPAHIQQPMIEKVVNHLHGKGDNPCTLDEALITMKMMEVGIGNDFNRITS